MYISELLQFRLVYFGSILLFSTVIDLYWNLQFIIKNKTKNRFSKVKFSRYYLFSENHWHPYYYQLLLLLYLANKNLINVSHIFLIGINVTRVKPYLNLSSSHTHCSAGPKQQKQIWHNFSFFLFDWYKLCSLCIEANDTRGKTLDSQLPTISMSTIMLYYNICIWHGVTISSKGHVCAMLTIAQNIL